ncbi:MAG: hypothetical protein R6U68_05400, partial [Desulfobacteraceae bacterium]
LGRITDGAAGCCGGTDLPGVGKIAVNNALTPGSAKLNASGTQETGKKTSKMRGLFFGRSLKQPA